MVSRATHDGKRDLSIFSLVMNGGKKDQMLMAGYTARLKDIARHCKNHSKRFIISDKLICRIIDICKTTNSFNINTPTKKCIR